MTFRLMLAGSLALCLAPISPVSGQNPLAKLKKAVAGDYQVRGRLQVHDGQWLTCFNDIKTGYLGPIDMARPGDAKTDPATGRVRVTTGAIPTIIRTRSGVVTSNDCDSLAKQELLVADLPAVATSDTGYSDPYGCVKSEWTKDEVVSRRREIMECQSEAITERAWQRSQAKAGNAGESTKPNAGGNSSSQAASAKLQEETAEKMKAIQQGAATPAAATTQDPEDLAWDGAKLCSLKPAYLMKLRGEAVQFVRYDAAGGKIVLSEMSGGERREVRVEGNGFAQRISFNAQAIGQGGDTCGRAFWSAEAYKAASAAMSR